LRQRSWCANPGGFAWPGAALHRRLPSLSTGGGLRREASLSP
jgi:hypothetical protein